MQIGKPNNKDNLRLIKANLMDSRINVTPYSVAGTNQNGEEIINKIDVKIKPNQGKNSLNLSLLGCFKTILVRQKPYLKPILAQLPKDLRLVILTSTKSVLNNKKPASIIRMERSLS